MSHACAVGQGNARKALGVLARMFAAGEDDREAVGRVFGQLVRQIRLIFTAKCHPGQTAQRTGLPPFVAGKIDAQARRFSETSLRAAYTGLVRLDEDLKGGSAVAAKDAPVLRSPLRPPKPRLPTRARHDQVRRRRVL